MRPVTDKRRAVRRIACALALLAAMLSGPAAASGPAAGGDRDPGAAARVAAWLALLALAERPEPERLMAVNRFFNRFRQEDDETAAGVADRWSMPDELLRTGVGDCEDFAIAKFATLLALGVPASRLSLGVARAYSAARKRIEHHMILAYRSDAGRPALILDNRTDAVLPLEDRPDLGPLASSPRLRQLELELSVYAPGAASASPVQRLAYGIVDGSAGASNAGPSASAISGR